MDTQTRGNSWNLVHTVRNEATLPMAVMDAHLRLVQVSPALEEMTNSPFRPMPSEDVPATFNLHDESGTRSISPSELTLVRACTAGSSQHSYVTVKPTGGPTRLLRCTALPLWDDNGVRGALLVATDASEERPIAAVPPELRRARLAALQHEVRTPLTVLLGHAEFLRDLGPDLPPGARASLAGVERASRRLVNALDALSAYIDGRLPAG